jgi:hypothetical protein
MAQQTQLQSLAVLARALVRNPVQVDKKLRTRLPMSYRQMQNHVLVRYEAKTNAMVTLNLSDIS